MKKIKYAPLLLLLGLLSFSFTGCIIEDDDDYYHPNPNPQPSGYQHVFTEDFNSDSRGWTFDDPQDSTYGLVANGQFKLVDESRLGALHMVVVSTSTNTSRNFLIRSRMKSNYAMGLIFGASNSSYGYSFFIDEAGYFAVYKEGSTPETLIDWQQSTAIKAGWNDVEIEQVADYWYGYINGVKVFQTPARVLAGAKMGYMVLANTTGYADYLTVKW